MVITLVVIAVLFLVIAAVAVGFVWLTRKRNTTVEGEMRSEVNHVYGTYEVSADPVAEVTASLLFETHFFIFN